MADQIIRPSDLPVERDNPNKNEFMVVDNGTTVAKSTIEDVVLSGRPTASQSEAEEGVDPYKAMTPLTTRQAIEAIYQPIPDNSIVGAKLVTGAVGSRELGDASVELRHLSAPIASAINLIGYGILLPETRTWLAYIQANGLVEPRWGMTRAVDDFIAEVIDSGAWSSIGILNAFFLNDGPTSRLNIKAPGVRTWIEGGGIVHEPGVGYPGDGIGRYLRLGIGANLVPNYTRNAASIGVFNTGGATTGNLLSTVSGVAGPGFGINPKGPGTPPAGANYNMRVNNTTIFNVTGFNNRSGLSISVRDGASSLKAYRDGVLVGSTAQASEVDPSTAEITILRSGSAYEDDVIHGAIFGGSLTDPMVTGINSAFANLRTAVGAF